MYIPFLIYYNFPSLSARGGNRFDFKYHLSIYYINDFFLEKLSYINDNLYTTVGRDYESFVLEQGASFFPIKNFEIGLDFRIISYYGGFLDPVIEGFHNAFGLPNAGRQYVPQNQVNIDISNNNNVKLSLHQGLASFGDIDFWTKYTFYEKRWISLASIGALKIPSGNISFLSGSGYPDFALGILADFRPIWILSFYLQSGIVVPIDSIIPNIPSKPYPMFNGLVGIELNPLSFFSLNVQMNIKSSPLSSNISHWFFTNADYLSLPQTNLLVGVIFQYKKFKWQFYLEEDAITNAGADITFNLSFSQKLNFNKGL